MTTVTSFPDSNTAKTVWTFPGVTTGTHFAMLLRKTIR